MFITKTCEDGEEYEEFSSEFEGFVEKLYSLEPYGIGIRPLYKIEKKALERVASVTPEGESGEEMYRDLLTLYRAGNLELFPPPRRPEVKYFFDNFVNVLRHWVIENSGPSSIVDALCGETDWNVRRIDREIDLLCEEVRNFNKELDTVNAFDENMNPTQEFKRKALPFIKRGIEKMEIMFYQSILYYDLLSNFAFDKTVAIMGDRKFDWHEWQYDEESVLDFKGPLYALSYADSEVILEMRFSSKYCYSIYKHDVKVKGIKYKKDELYYVLEVSNNLLFCTNHMRFLCPKTVPVDNRNLLIMRGKSHVIDYDFVVRTVLSSSLVNEDKSLVSHCRFFLQNRSNYEQIYILFLFLRRTNPILATKWKESMAFEIRLGGMMYREIRIHFFVKIRMELFFSRDLRDFIEMCEKYNLREDALYPKTRVDNYNRVAFALQTKMALLGWESCTMRIIGVAKGSNLALKLLDQEYMMWTTVGGQMVVALNDDRLRYLANVLINPIKRKRE